MAQRPTSMIVVGWILIVLSAIGFLSMAMMSALINNPMMQQTLAANPLPPSVILVVGYFGCLVGLVCGIGCLKRWGWARYVYALWCAASLLFNLFTSPYSKALLIPGFTISLVVIVFMFLPEANAWFANKGNKPETA